MHTKSSYCSNAIISTTVTILLLWRSCEKWSITLYLITDLPSIPVSEVDVSVTGHSVCGELGDSEVTRENKYQNTKKWSTRVFVVIVNQIFVMFWHMCQNFEILHKVALLKIDFWLSLPTFFFLHYTSISMLWWTFWGTILLGFSVECLFLLRWFTFCRSKFFGKRWKVNKFTWQDPV